jgi:signal transduction histidine kinase
VTPAEPVPPPPGPAAAPGPVEPTGAVLAALAAALGTVTSEASLDRVLHQLASSARDLAGARYAAIGIPEPEGDEFARFVTVGMSDELIDRIGPLPRTHGLLAAMLSETQPYRTPDIRADPRFEWWPAAHPRMGSFLGVPVVARGAVVGALYLADKEGAEEFSAADEDSIVLLASHAALAIEHARLVEDSRQLALVAERARLARELHDAMSQSLFSLQLSVGTAAGLLRSDPDRAADELATVQRLAAGIVAELRSTVEGLRPAELERDGLVAVLCDQLAVTARAHDVAIDLDACEDPMLDAEGEHQVLRIVQEAVGNAVRHAAAHRIAVTLAVHGPGGPARSGELVARVVDDGAGFDPGDVAHRARRLGLTSMDERAAALGGRLTIDSTPGAGTTVELRVPR